MLLVKITYCFPEDVETKELLDFQQQIEYSSSGTSMKESNLRKHGSNIIINLAYFALFFLLVLQNQFVTCTPRHLKSNVPHSAEPSVQNGQIISNPTNAPLAINLPTVPSPPTFALPTQTLPSVTFVNSVSFSSVPEKLQYALVPNHKPDLLNTQIFDKLSTSSDRKINKKINENQQRNQNPVDTRANNLPSHQTSQKQEQTQRQEENWKPHNFQHHQSQQELEISNQSNHPRRLTESTGTVQVVQKTHVDYSQRITVNGFRAKQKEQNEIAAAVALNNNFVTGSPGYYYPGYPAYQPVGYVGMPYQYLNYPTYVYPQQYYYQPIPYQPNSMSNGYYQQQTQAQQNPQVQTPPTSVASTSSSNYNANIIISPNTGATITTTTNSNGGTTTTVTPTETQPTTPPVQVPSSGDSFTAQVTNNLINNIFTHLLPKNDPNLSNTGPAEKVYHIKNIDLNVTNVNNNAGTTTTSTTPPTTNIVTTVNTNGVDAQQLSNTSATSIPVLRGDNTTATSTISPFQITGGTDIPLPPLTDSSAPATTDPTFNPNATIKTPIVNGTITGTAVLNGNGNVRDSGSQIKFKYQQYLAKYKPNVLTQNPSDLTLYRQTIFNLNINTINQHNANPNKTYEVGVNLFTDLTLDEFNRLYAKLIVPEEVKTQAQAQVATISSQGKPIFTTPPSLYIDWSCKASPPISQGVCGACYTIAALQSITMSKRMRGLSVNFLSIQEVISCGSNSRDLDGCVGGYFSGAYNYAKNTGIGQSSLYFYDDKAKFEGVLSPCDSAFTKNPVYDRSRQFIKEGVRIRFGDCAQVVKQLQFRVLTVAIAAYGFQFYTSGVFRTANTYINHGVTLVGYNPVNRSYLIKNSWGTTWGDVGYGYIDQSTSLCHYAMYPNLLPQEENRNLEKCLEVKIPIPTTGRNPAGG